ncbi:MAG: hypothetical protein KY457_02550 [Actinobacteria bacterium]|nr:hypothetical protein [Actinomycetota bacterium]
MTEPDAVPDEVDDPAARLRSLGRRLRREKRVLERLNPLEEPERYEALFTRVVELEAERRALRGASGGGDDDGDGEPDDPGGD